MIEDKLYHPIKRPRKENKEDVISGADAVKTFKSLKDQIDLLIGYKDLNAVQFFAKVKHILIECAQDKFIVAARDISKDLKLQASQILAKVFTNTSCLDQSSMLIGLFVLCACVGEPAFSKLSGVSMHIRDSRFPNVLCEVKNFYSKHFGNYAGKWIEKHIELVNLYTYDVLMCKVNERFELCYNDSMVEVCLWLHTVVDIQDKFDDFVCICNLINSSEWRQTILNSLEKVKQHKMETGEMMDLIVFLTKQTNKHLIDDNAETVKTEPIFNWDSIIKNSNASKLFSQYKKPVKEYVEELDKLIGDNFAYKSVDKLLNEKSMLKVGLIDSHLSPHNYQIAIAFYAFWKASKARVKNNFIFEVGPGMGKSRIMMCLALTFICKSMFNIRIVFSNEKLS